ncbi:MAG: cupin domain-containing protein [Gammaproteobacteria bacterium]|nr:cupin domain-containing protein [Gammaproteobacteria bacterium]
MKITSHYEQLESYTTKDKSIIRELMHPAVQGNRQQSLAEAIVAIDQETALHKHITSEELYFLTQGEGLMSLGDECFVVQEGDTICIPAGTPHKIRNTGKNELKILCCSAPAYAHDDTVLL